MAAQQPFYMAESETRSTTQDKLRARLIQSATNIFAFEGRAELTSTRIEAQIRNILISINDLLFDSKGEISDWEKIQAPITPDEFKFLGDRITLTLEGKPLKVDIIHRKTYQDPQLPMSERPISVSYADFGVTTKLTMANKLDKIIDEVELNILRVLVCGQGSGN